MFIYIWCLEENIVLLLSNVSCMFKLLMCDNAFVQLKRIVSASFDNLLCIGSFELCVATFCFTLHRWCLMFMHLLPSKNFVYKPLFYASAVCISHCWAFVCDFWRFMVRFAYPFTVAPVIIMVFEDISCDSCLARFQYRNHQFLHLDILECFTFIS